MDTGGTPIHQPPAGDDMLPMRWSLLGQASTAHTETHGGTPRGLAGRTMAVPRAGGHREPASLLEPEHLPPGSPRVFRFASLFSRKCLPRAALKEEPVAMLLLASAPWHPPIRGGSAEWLPGP